MDASYSRSHRRTRSTDSQKNTRVTPTYRMSAIADLLIVVRAGLGAEVTSDPSLATRRDRAPQDWASPHQERVKDADDGAADFDVFLTSRGYLLARWLNRAVLPS